MNDPRPPNNGENAPAAVIPINDSGTRDVIAQAVKALKAGKRLPTSKTKAKAKAKAPDRVAALRLAWQGSSQVARRTFVVEFSKEIRGILKSPVTAEA